MKIVSNIIFICLLLVGVSGLLAVDRSKVKSGVEAFESHRWDEALNHFQNALLDDPENPLLHFNIGDAFYKKDNYEEALKSFEKALRTDDPALQQKTYYNLGNVHYQMNQYQEAIAAYKKALELDPEDTDAKHNLELVRAKLKEMADKQSMNPDVQNQQQGGGAEGSSEQNQQQQGEQQQQQQQQQAGGDEQNDQEQEQQDRQSAQQDKLKDQQQNQQQDQSEQQELPEQQQPVNAEEKKELSKEEAEQILQALRGKERDNTRLRPVPPTSRKTRVEKDW